MNKHNINEEQKINYWKVATFVLFAMAVFLLVGMDLSAQGQRINSRTEKIVPVGDFNFSQQEYNQIKNMFNEYLVVSICNMQETNKTITCIKLIGNQNVSSSK